MINKIIIFFNFKKFLKLVSVKNIIQTTKNKIAIGKVSNANLFANGIRWIENTENIKTNLLSLISIIYSVYQAVSVFKMSKEPKY